MLRAFNRIGFVQFLGKITNGEIYFFLYAWESTTVASDPTTKHQFTRLLMRDFNGFILLSVLI